MTATQSNLAGLSRFIFRAPSWYASLAFALLLAALAGLAAFDTGRTTDTWRGLLFVGRDAWEGIFFIGVPTVVASVVTTGVDRFLGGRLTPNRSSLLALTCEVLIVAIVTFAAIVSTLSGVVPGVTPLGQTFVYDALVIALASVFAFRLLVVMAVSRSSLLVAAVPASIQTLASAVLLFVYSGTVTFLEVGGPILSAYLMPYLDRAGEAPAEITVIGPNHFVLLGVTCVVYALAVYGFLTVIDRPWRQSMGVSMLDFLRGFIGHVAEGSRELEDFFEDLGEEAVVPVTVLSFRRSDDTEKARFVLPMIHPGPMGEIGGGNFPERVARRAEGLAFPPHATAGHDFNLVTEREVDTILDTADDAFGRIEYADAASDPVRADVGEVTVLGQAFGDGALLVSSYAPNFADDVEYAVGLSAAAEARTSGLESVMLVDAHNSNDGLSGPDLGHVTPGSRRSFDMISAAGDLGGALAGSERGPLALGTAWDRTPWTPREGIGPLGIRAAVTEVGDTLTAYVLVDGNNMEPGLRDRVLDALPDAVDAAEVMTTDTHIVNTVEADNQVGAALPQDELVGLVRDLVESAMADREPVTAGMAVEHAEVTVFGNDRTETLASHANAVVSLGGALAAAVILAAMAVSVLIFLFA
jgi:putative membrane protein